VRACLPPASPHPFLTTHQHTHPRSGEQKDVFNLKEIEALASKQGVVQQRCVH
jgi:hypothetical protein